MGVVSALNVPQLSVYPTNIGELQQANPSRARYAIDLLELQKSARIFQVLVCRSYEDGCVALLLSRPRLLMSQIKLIAQGTISAQYDFRTHSCYQ